MTDALGAYRAPRFTRSRIEQIQIEQMLARGSTTRCPDAALCKEAPRPKGHMMPDHLNPLYMGEPETVDAKRAIREYEAHNANERRRFELLTAGG